jgi:8-oxo-dGTP pyrophosphatase MutT (NUDIX family)
MALSEENLRERLAVRRPRLVALSERTTYASVAAILRYQAAEPDVLLIRRTDKPEDPWAGHMAFPGGRHEAGDGDLVATAVRETREEVGVDLGHGARLLGRLDDVQAISHARLMDMVVVPHVFVVTQPVDLRLERSEVADALWTPLGPMLRGEVDTSRPYVHDGTRLELPGYRVGTEIVWGLTYRMLQLLFELAA